MGEGADREEGAALPSGTANGSAARHVIEEGYGLRLHLLEWGDGERVILLLHGFLEHAHACERRDADDNVLAAGLGSPRQHQRHRRFQP